MSSLGDRGPRAAIFALQAVILAAVLALWEWLAYAGAIDPHWVSSPSRLAQAFLASLRSGEIVRHLGVTAGEALSGLVVGAGIGIALGLLLGMSRLVGAALEPFVVALNALPRVALAPLIIMFVGIGFASKFLLAVSLVVVPMMINTYEGIRSIDPALVKVMQVYRASRAQIFFKVLLPNCVPWLFSGLRVSISFAIIGAIVGELISARAGIGFMIDRAAGDFNVGGMLMPLVVLMLAAFSLDRLVLALSNVLMRWREAAQ